MWMYVVTKENLLMPLLVVAQEKDCEISIDDMTLIQRQGRKPRADKNSQWR
jgi:hypothetical protein